MKSIYTLTLMLAFVLALSLTGFAKPGVPEQSTPSDQKLGSLLVFNLYTSSITDPGTRDTDFSLTNVNRAQDAFVHLFLIGGSCTVADTFVCLTPNQTASFLASDIDPGQTGYAIAMAVDNATGCPLSFNYLLGSEFVKLDSGHAANLAAEGYSALFEGTVPGCSNTSTLATILLDGSQYSAAGRLLAVDKIPSAVDGNSTLLIVNSLEGNLAIGMQIIGSFNGVIFDDAENGYQFTSTASCQLNKILTNSFPLTVPPFQTVIPAGRTGWMRLSATQDQAISGAVINFNPGAATIKGRFNGGHNLHPLRFTSGNLIVPIFPPFC